jgi:hypothetical protein
MKLPNLDQALVRRAGIRKWWDLETEFWPYEFRIDTDRGEIAVKTVKAQNEDYPAIRFFRNGVDVTCAVVISGDEPLCTPILCRSEDQNETIEDEQRPMIESWLQSLDNDFGAYGWIEKVPSFSGEIDEAQKLMQKAKVKVRPEDVVKLHRVFKQQARKGGEPNKK